MRVARAPIPGFPGYEIDTDGNVWSFKRYPAGKRLRATPNAVLGYPIVSLRVAGRTVAHFVHRLVLLTFVGQPETGQQACHNNGVRSDVRLANLRWGTARENAADKLLHGTHGAGERASRAKLTRQQVVDIRAMRAAGAKVAEVGRAFGITQGHVTYICRGHGWKGAGGALTGKRLPAARVPQSA